MALSMGSRYPGAVVHDDGDGDHRRGMVLAATFAGLNLVASLLVSSVHETPGLDDKTKTASMSGMFVATGLLVGVLLSAVRRPRRDTARTRYSAVALAALGVIALYAGRGAFDARPVLLVAGAVLWLVTVALLLVGDSPDQLTRLLATGVYAASVACTSLAVLLAPGSAATGLDVSPERVAAVEAAASDPAPPVASDPTTRVDAASGLAVTLPAGWHFVEKGVAIGLGQAPTFAISNGRETEAQMVIVDSRVTCADVSCAGSIVDTLRQNGMPVRSVAARPVTIAGSYPGVRVVLAIEGGTSGGAVYETIASDGRRSILITTASNHDADESLAALAEAALHPAAG